MADGEGRAREGEGEGGEAFYLSRKTFTTKMGGAGDGDGRRDAKGG